MTITEIQRAILTVESDQAHRRRQLKDGDKCLADLNKCLADLREQLVRTGARQDETYTIGQRFARMCPDGTMYAEIYLLAQVGPSMVTLIGMTSGNRWKEPLRIRNTSKIPARVFNEHFTTPNALRWDRIV